MVLHGLGDLYREKIKNPYVRIVFSSIIIIILTVILHTDDYMGAGVPVIVRAIGGKVNPMAFIWKMIFTALTLEAGFKGGEIVPSFFYRSNFWLPVWRYSWDFSITLCSSWHDGCILWCYKLPHNFNAHSI